MAGGNHGRQANDPRHYETYSNYKRNYGIADRDRNLNIQDVEGAAPNIFPGNKYRNKPDLRYHTKDLDYSLKN